MDNKKSKENQSELENFDISFNEFGELVRSHPLEEVNDFLDKNLKDKKLKNIEEEE